MIIVLSRNPLFKYCNIFKENDITGKENLTRNRYNFFKLYIKNQLIIIFNLRIRLHYVLEIRFLMHGMEISRSLIIIDRRLLFDLCKDQYRTSFYPIFHGQIKV